MRCDTCGREVFSVKRVVIAKGYNRALSRAIYNCPSCFDKKEVTRHSSKEKKGGKGRG